ncbi:helix-turn-helix domain-containing protein [Streptomyces virginiae]|uniref:helix-turn-helix domain-containing protein n=1 Tax=Streptomyces virginiae TaxID=1961 RepID=UPI0022526A50|nr:helix-turn-helix transcriptional regulator [Streptomyces virginiae]MCX5175087.1 helix-turn-helix domain-containing protein [Streptomyces virginiae]
MPEDTAGPEFAGLLRQLKERSGLSYGTLAGRLHMSTSTLHRYCSGEVVPADYAPVERLARLCKATPEELLALHRGWVEADTNRPRRGADTSGPAATEVAVEATAVADEAPTVVAEVAEVPTVAGPAGPPAPARRPRPRRAVLAAVAVPVVAAVTALTWVLTLDGGRPERGADVRDSPVAAGRTPGAEKSRQGPDGSSAPTSPSPSVAAPSGPVPAAPAPGGGGAGGVGTGVGTGGGSGGGGGSGSGTGGGAGDAAGAPVKVTVRPHTWEAPCGQHYLIDKPPAQVGPPPVERDAPAWVAAAGAVPAGEQYVTLTLQGSGTDTVVLDGLAVRTVAKRAPLPWNDYAMGYPGVGCGAGVPTRSFGVSLDSARPAVVPTEGQRGFPFSVTESQPEVFHVLAAASAHDVSWYLELSWSSGSRHGTLAIDHNGRPFRTSGRDGRPGYEFPLGGEGWVRAGTGS